jgi:hypothetical protein
MSCLLIVRSLVVLSLIGCLVKPSRCDEPVAPPPSRPAISIGGPFGVIIGGGHGLRIGGSNGAQFGGGAGARFGGDYGAQFGGGEGVRFGPRFYGPTGQDVPSAPPVNGTVNEAIVHLPQAATKAVRLRVNGEEVELKPGDTIAAPSGAYGAVIQLPRARGRYGVRRMVQPGTYLLGESRRGWTLVRGQLPTRPQLAPQRARDPNAPNEFELNPPALEELPAPPARSVLSEADRD